MKRLFSSQSILAAGLAIGALAAASGAHAAGAHERADRAPVVRVTVKPQVVHLPVRPAPVDTRGNARGGVWGDADRDGVPNVYDRQSRFYDPRAAHRSGWADSDRDGVANRYDRAPNNPRRH
jgi:hypothetical protein